MQADHVNLSHKAHHSRQVSDTGSQSYSTPNSPDMMSLSFGRTVSMATGMSASSLGGTPLFPLLSSPHAHSSAGQEALYRVSSAPGTLSCQSSPGTHTPTPNSPLHSFTHAQMTASLASSSVGSASGMGATQLAGTGPLPTIYSPASGTQAPEPTRTTSAAD